MRSFAIGADSARKIIFLASARSCRERIGFYLRNEKVQLMDRETELAIVRRAYAKQILAAARISDPRLRAAFAAVPREDFLGPGPWLGFRMPGFYQPTVDADPVLLYVNELFGLVA